MAVDPRQRYQKFQRPDEGLEARQLEETESHINRIWQALNAMESGHAAKINQVNSQVMAMAAAPAPSVSLDYNEIAARVLPITDAHYLTWFLKLDCSNAPLTGPLSQSLVSSYQTNLDGPALYSDYTDPSADTRLIFSLWDPEDEYACVFRFGLWTIPGPPSAPVYSQLIGQSISLYSDPEFRFSVVNPSTMEASGRISFQNADTYIDQNGVFHATGGYFTGTVNILVDSAPAMIVGAGSGQNNLDLYAFTDSWNQFGSINLHGYYVIWDISEYYWFGDSTETDGLSLASGVFGLYQSGFASIYGHGGDLDFSGNVTFISENEDSPPFNLSANNTGVLVAGLNADLLDGYEATAFEPALGNPAADGYVLSSTTGGVRSWIVIPSGVTDHGALTGLNDDDHSQYHTDGRGDLRYSPLAHNHDSSYISIVGTPTAGNFPVLTVGGELDNSAYSPSSFAASGHNHDGSYSALGHTHDDRYYTETEISTSGSASVHWGNLTNIPSSFTPAAHQLDGAAHTVSGLTTGHFLKATGAATFGFAVHGLTYSDVGAAASGHNHDSDYISIVGSPTAGNFPVLTAGGELTNSTYGPSSFADAAHAHDASYLLLDASNGPVTACLAIEANTGGELSMDVYNTGTTAASNAAFVCKAMGAAVRKARLAVASDSIPGNYDTRGYLPNSGICLLEFDWTHLVISNIKSTGPNYGYIDFVVGGAGGAARRAYLGGGLPDFVLTGLEAGETIIGQTGDDLTLKADYNDDSKGSPRIRFSFGVAGVQAGIGYRTTNDYRFGFGIAYDSATAKFHVVNAITNLVTMKISGAAAASVDIAQIFESGGKGMGVTKDGYGYANTVFKTDHIAEFTGSYGVTIDNVLKVDHIAEASTSAGVQFDDAVTTTAGLLDTSGVIESRGSSYAYMVIRHDSATGEPILGFRQNSGTDKAYLMYDDKVTAPDELTIKAPVIYIGSTDGDVSSTHVNAWIGQFGFQAYDRNNLLLGLNCYYGTDWTSRNQGYVGVLQYVNGALRLYGGADDYAAGTTGCALYQLFDFSVNQIDFSVSTTTGNLPMFLWGYDSGAAATRALKTWIDTDGTAKLQVVDSGRAAVAEDLYINPSAGSLRAGGYKSADGTAGESATITIAGLTSITVKNGLVTAHA